MSKTNDSMSAAADAETASSSNREEITKGLNEDLAREYKAIIQYLVFSSTLKGRVWRYSRTVEKTRFTGTGTCSGSIKTDRLAGWRSNYQMQRNWIFRRSKEDA